MHLSDFLWPTIQSVIVYMLLCVLSVYCCSSLISICFLGDSFRGALLLLVLVFTPHGPCILWIFPSVVLVHPFCHWSSTLFTTCTKLLRDTRTPSHSWPRWLDGCTDGIYFYCDLLWWGFEWLQFMVSSSLSIYSLKKTFIGLWKFSTHTKAYAVFCVGLCYERLLSGTRGPDLHRNTRNNSI